MTKQVDALGNVTTFTYDGNGNLVSKTDPDGYTTEYTCNALDLVTSIDYNDVKKTSTVNTRFTNYYAIVTNTNLKDLKNGTVTPTAEALSSYFTSSNWSVASILAKGEVVIVESNLGSYGVLTSYFNHDMMTAMSNAMARYIIDQINVELNKP